MVRRLATVLVLGSCLSLAACGGGGGAAPPASAPAAPSAAVPAAGASAEAAGPVKAPGEAKVGERTRCPVSGEEFTVAENSPHSEHDGKTYYFCCPGCQKKFEANPDQYLKKN